MRPCPFRCRWLLLLSLPGFVLPAGATPAATVPASAPATTTGDAWVDRQLADIDRYAARYPAAFLDEMDRYGGTRRDYAAALLRQPGWSAGDVWFACHWAQAVHRTCREVVRARAASAAKDWKSVVQALDPQAGSAPWRGLRRALVASYDRWDRPIALEPALRAELGDRAQRLQRALQSPGADAGR